MVVSFECGETEYQAKTEKQIETQYINVGNQFACN